MTPSREVMAEAPSTSTSGTIGDEEEVEVDVSVSSGEFDLQVGWVYLP